MNRAERRRQEALARKLNPPGAAPKIVLPKAPALTDPTVIAHYANAASLHQIGPLIPASWSVPAALAVSLRNAGRAVPAPVQGHLLIDTGATNTSMALAVARQLQLTRIGFADTLGAGGVTRHEVFFAHIELVVADSFGNKQTVGADRRAIGIPDLEKSLNPPNTARPTNVPIAVIGLLGRDFLQYTTLTYHGSSGIVELVLDTSTIPSATRVGP